MLTPPIPCPSCAGWGTTNGRTDCRKCRGRGTLEPTRDFAAKIGTYSSSRIRVVGYTDSLPTEGSHIVFQELTHNMPCHSDWDCGLVTIVDPNTPRIFLDREYKLRRADV